MKVRFKIVLCLLLAIGTVAPLSLTTDDDGEPGGSGCCHQGFQSVAAR